MARRAVHDVFGVAATYQDASLPEPVALRIRWHNKTANLGMSGEQGLTTLVESVEQVVFDREELAQKAITPRRGGTVTLTDYQDNGRLVRLYLDNSEPYDGPINLVWSVGRDI